MPAGKVLPLAGTVTAGAVLPEETNVDVASHVPPVHTKTWFHTGAYLDASRISVAEALAKNGAPQAEASPRGATWLSSNGRVRHARGR